MGSRIKRGVESTWYKEIIGKTPKLAQLNSSQVHGLAISVFLEAYVTVAFSEGFPF